MSEILQIRYPVIHAAMGLTHTHRLERQRLQMIVVDAQCMHAVQASKRSQHEDSWEGNREGWSFASRSWISTLAILYARAPKLNPDPGDF